jgi:hypothetical protein
MGVLLIAALAGYWWASPVLAIRAMQQAAARGDAEAFGEHVDYPRLRESLKGELARQMTRRYGGAGNGLAGAALGAVLGLGVVDGLVDTFVRPEVVMRVMQEGKLLPPAGRTSPSTDAGASATNDAGRLRWGQEHQGLDRYIATAWRGDAGKRISLVLERSGFATWKLVEIRLPPP